MLKISNKDHCWNNAPKIKHKDPKKYRLGAAGALIKYEEYGLQSKLGWNIDHRMDTSFETKDRNIRAMHWKNNQKKGNSGQFLGEAPLNEVVYHRELVYDPKKGINVQKEKDMSFTNDVAKDK